MVIRIIPVGDLGEEVMKPVIGGIWGGWKFGERFDAGTRGRRGTGAASRLRIEASWSRSNHAGSES